MAEQKFESFVPCAFKQGPRNKRTHVLGGPLRDHSSHYALWIETKESVVSPVLKVQGESTEGDGVLTRPPPRHLSARVGDAHAVALSTGCPWAPGSCRNPADGGWAPSEARTQRFPPPSPSPFTSGHYLGLCLLPARARGRTDYCAHLGVPWCQAK